MAEHKKPDKPLSCADGIAVALGRIPDPLPCGCRIMQEQSIKDGNAVISWTHAAHVVHCPLHAAAPDLLAFAKAHEAWEADLVIGGDWTGEYPRLTKAQYDRAMELQAMRNAALAKAVN